ncbi:MAG: hypothetical protein V2A79_12305 [Planctomycetota bacterium]
MTEEQPNIRDREFLVSRYLDGDLTDAERREMENALHADPALARLLEAYRRTEALLRAQRDRGPELDWERFASEIRRRCAVEGTKPRWSVFYRLYAPLATAAVIALVCTVYFMARQKPEGPPGPAPTVMVRLTRPAEPEKLTPGERVVAVRMDRTPPTRPSTAPLTAGAYVIAAAGAKPFDRAGVTQETNPFF